MSVDAAAPCFVCGRTLPNVFDDGLEANNQPSEATEFSTHGHYGSTFWDPMSGEELVLNICDEHLREHEDRLVIRRTARPRVECTYQMFKEAVEQ